MPDCCVDDKTCNKSLITLFKTNQRLRKRYGNSRYVRRTEPCVSCCSAGLSYRSTIAGQTRCKLPLAVINMVGVGKDGDRKNLCCCFRKQNRKLRKRQVPYQISPHRVSSMGLAPGGFQAYFMHQTLIGLLTQLTKELPSELVATSGGAWWAYNYSRFSEVRESLRRVGVLLEKGDIQGCVKEVVRETADLFDEKAASESALNGSLEEKEQYYFLLIFLAGIGLDETYNVTVLAGALGNMPIITKWVTSIYPSEDPLRCSRLLFNCSVLNGPNPIEASALQGRQLAAIQIEDTGDPTDTVYLTTESENPATPLLFEIARQSDGSNSTRYVPLPSEPQWPPATFDYSPMWLPEDIPPPHGPSPDPIGGLVLVIPPAFESLDLDQESMVVTAATMALGNSLWAGGALLASWPTLGPFQRILGQLLCSSVGSFSSEIIQNWDNDPGAWWSLFLERTRASYKGETQLIKELGEGTATIFDGGASDGTGIWGAVLASTRKRTNIFAFDFNLVSKEKSPYASGYPCLGVYSGLPLQQGAGKCLEDPLPSQDWTGAIKKLWDPSKKPRRNRELVIGNGRVLARRFPVLRGQSDPSIVAMGSYHIRDLKPSIGDTDRTFDLSVVCATVSGVKSLAPSWSFYETLIGNFASSIVTSNAAKGASIADTLSQVFRGGVSKEC